MDNVTEAPPELGSSLDSIFNDLPTDLGADPVVEDAPEVAAEQQEPPPAPEGDLDEVEGQPTEEQPEQQEQPAEDDEEWTDEEAEKLAATKDGRRIVSKSRFDHLYRTYRQAKAIEKELGTLPSVEDLKQYSKSFGTINAMRADIESGDPDRVGRFVAHWAKRSDDALPLLIDRSIEQLRSDRPEDYGVLSQHFVEESINGLYDRAAQLKASNDPYYTKFIFAVQTLDYNVSGKYRTTDQVSAPDAIDERLERAERLERSQRERDVRVRSEAAASFRAGVDSALSTARTASVDEAMGPIAESYKDRPRMFSAIKQSLDSQASEIVAKDQLFNAKYRPLRERAEREMSADLKQQVVEAYKQRYERAVKQLRAAVIKEATGARVAQSQQTHAKLAASSAKKEPSTAAGKPTSPVVVNEKYKAASDRGNLSDMIDALVSGF